MSPDQEKTGEGRYTLPVNGQPANGLPAIVGNIAALGFDNLPAQQAAACGQYPHGGPVPISAYAAPVQAAGREVQP